MAATVFCNGVPSGLTLTASIFPDGSDTASQTGLTCTEATNRKTTYSFPNTGDQTGLHLIQLKSGSNVVWVGWAVLAASGTIQASDERRVAAYLDAAISGISGGGSGSGAYVVTITVNDGSTALQNATVRLNDGVNQFTAITNVSGVATFSLDNATYTVSITKGGYSFTPTTLAVSGATSHTYSMTAVSITPSDPGQTTGYVTIYTAEHVAVSGATVEIQILKLANGTTGSGIDDPLLSRTTNGSGYVEFTGLPRLATYQARVNGGKWAKGVTLDAASTPLAGVLGLPE